jgi:hypothetical protein
MGIFKSFLNYSNKQPELKIMILWGFSNFIVQTNLLETLLKGRCRFSASGWELRICIFASSKLMLVPLVKGVNFEQQGCSHLLLLLVSGLVTLGFNQW